MTSPQLLLKIFKLKAKKDLGQNFLSDPSTAEMILDRAGIFYGHQGNLIEIGPGLGALTLAASRRVSNLHAIEADRDLIPVLESEITRAECTNIHLHQGNFLKMDLAPFLAEGRSTTIIGNLPYNISSQILIRILRFRDRIDRGIFMLQAEMAERMVARPGKKDYGRLSVGMQYCGDIRILSQVRAHLFYPKPKVNSSVIEIRFKENPDPAAKDEKLFFDVVRAAFGQRRKTLRNSLSAGIAELDAKGAENLLQKAGIDPTRRAETLSVEEFVHLTNTWYAEVQSFAPADDVNDFTE